MLDAQPTSDVVLTVTSSDTGEATVNSPLTFTPANWDTAQTVTVTGVDDDLVDGTITSTITLAVDDANADDSFDVVVDQTVSLITTDDDVAGSRLMSLKVPQRLMSLEPLTHSQLCLTLSQHQTLS